VLTVAVWAAALPFIMDPDYNLAVTRRYGSISNPILYFFSWAAFITSFFIMMGYLFQCYSSRCSDRRPAIFSCSASSHWLWVGLVLTSFVVMMTANRMVIEGHCCKVNKDSDPPRDWSDPTLPTKEVCDRLKVAVGLGTASAVLSFAWFLVNTFLVSSKNSILMCVDTVTVGLLLVLWTFGATWLTFNENKSPGADLCNLYFFTWGSWILALVMVMNSFHHIAAGMTSEAVCEAPVAEPTPGETKKDGGVPIGCMDENQNADAATHATQDDKHVDVEEAQT
jgi:hypothetical protein